MKQWGLLIWVPQFGISVVVPLIGFLMLAVWLRDHCGWGGWVIWVGIFFGLFTAAIGFRDTVKAMTLTDNLRKKDSSNISFNYHD